MSNIDTDIRYYMDLSMEEIESLVVTPYHIRTAVRHKLPYDKATQKPHKECGDVFVIVGGDNEDLDGEYICELVEVDRDLWAWSCSVRMFYANNRPYPKDQWVHIAQAMVHKLLLGNTGQLFRIHGEDPSDIIYHEYRRLTPVEHAMYIEPRGPQN